MEDTKIVQLYWDRDPNAIRASATKYGNYCTSIAKNILGNKEDAEECVNDTYLKAWNAMPPHRPNMLSTFLGKITRNLAFNRYKHNNADKRGGSEISAVLDELSECVSGKDNVEQEIEYKELVKTINSFLDTILSRAVALPFLPCGRDEIISFIMSKKKVPDYQAGIAAACSGGNPGLALKWVDSEEFAERKEKSLELLRRLGRMEPEMVFQTSMEWGKKKDEIFFFLRLVQVWLRDVLYIKASGKTTGLMFMEEKSYLQKQAASISYERINEISLGMEQLSQRLESNVNGEISLENFLMLFKE